MTAVSEVIIPSNPADRTKILKSLQAISDSLSRTEGEKEFIKAEIAALEENYDIPKKFLNKLARTYHKRNFEAVVKEVEDFELLYESIFNMNASDIDDGIEDDDE